MGKTLTKPKISVPAVSAQQWARPAQIILDVTFGEGNRKVTPADLERAAGAAAAAFRTSLESRTPTYTIASITGTVSYVYTMVRKTFSA